MSTDHGNYVSWMRKSSERQTLCRQVDLLYSSEMQIVGRGGLYFPSLSHQDLIVRDEYSIASEVRKRPSG